MKQITKIVITGGPCAGKSTALSRIGEEFSRLGYRVLFVPETATELITGGITPARCGSNLDFQSALVSLQMAKEQAFFRAASSMQEDKILIVCDRGLLDNKAYMTTDEFQAVLDALDMGEVEMRDTYDAVFHMVTAARGAEAFYTLANNAARTETPKQAREQDDKLIAAWTGHPHLRIIDNSTDFENKIARLLCEISAYLGEPEPYEIERKFLIAYPDLDQLDRIPNCRRVEIIQTYLLSAQDEEVRVRQRGDGAHFVYFHTVKKKISELKRIETERRIGEKEYLSLLLQADTARRQIRKTRYCLTYEGRYFEIDVYPFWTDRAIMEIELPDENASFTLPPMLRVLKEVTDDEAYKNASLAMI